MRLQAQNLSLSRAGRKLVDDVSIELNAGEFVGLVGPNGAGKSTLLTLLAGLTVCETGFVELDGTAIKEISLRERARKLAWLAQSGPVNWPLSVERVVALGRRPHLGHWQDLGENDKEAIERAIVATDCERYRKQKATTLSGGERTRMLLARALAAEPTILLADEPIATLDLRHQLQTMDLCRAFASEQNSCLVVLHDLSLAWRYCDRVYLMSDGRVFAQGKPGDVFTHDNLRDVYGVSVEMGKGQLPWVLPLEQV